MRCADFISFNVIGLGEVLWDLLPSGPQLGGAPANFACHAHALDADAQVISRVGGDPLGRELVDRFVSMGLPCKNLQVDAAAPTGTVSVRLSADGVPEYTIHENVAWDRIEVTREALTAVRAADAICFGTLAQRNPISRASIQQLLSAAPVTSWRVLDINLRQHFYSREIIERSLRLSNALKLNEEELPVVADFFGLTKSTHQQMQALADRFQLQLVVLTCGSQGSVIFKEGRWSTQKPAVVDVLDTVGAGDAFTAALLIGLLRKGPLDEIHAFAAEVASYVCTSPGATPGLPDRFRQAGQGN
jgi:fructokinase